MKSPKQIGYMREAGLVVAKIHHALGQACKPGVTTAQLDQISRKVIEQAGAHSNFLGYHGFPATTCISINDEIVHGIPGSRQINDGDLVKFDCGAYVIRDDRQWHADAAFTMIAGDASKADQRAEDLSTTTYLALSAAVAAIARGGKTLAVVGEAVEEIVASRASSVGWEADIVLDYTGHGIGNALHEPPEVLNYAVAGRMPKINTGQVFAIEPMLTAGSADNYVAKDGWTVLTKDGSVASQWEHTVAVTPGGVWVLTAEDGGVSLLAPHGLKPAPVS